LPLPMTSATVPNFVPTTKPYRVRAARICVVVCVVTLPSLPVSRCAGWVSLGNGSEAANSDQSRMNTAPAYRCISFGTVRLHIGQGIDTVEVRGSSPLVPTISSSTYSRSLSPLGRRWRRGGGFIIEKRVCDYFFAPLVAADCALASSFTCRARVFTRIF